VYVDYQLHGGGSGTKKISSRFADVGAGAGPIQVVEGEMNGRQNESMNMMKYGRGVCCAARLVTC
jgi:hypothetical protein